MEFKERLNTKEEFEMILSGLCDDYKVLNNNENYRFVDEIVYGLILNKDKENEKRFVVFSSISIYNNQFRGYAEDSIKIVPWGNHRPLKKAKRVHRTNNWVKRFTTRLLNFDNVCKKKITGS